MNRTVSSTPSRVRWFTALSICLVSLALLAKPSAAVGPGTAPVDPPTGGFGIEGNLGANVPTAGVGDWVPGAAGAGGFVLTAGGVPVTPATTFHLIDLYDSPVDDGFNGGLKFDDDPNTWGWNAGPVPDKNDINNGLVFFTRDPSNDHLWLVFG